jgi:galactose mutarotase-like enzyme
MLYEISNEYLTASVDTRGAELRSVRRTGDGLEYLWQGNPEFWAERAPVLFPLIGRLKKGSYSLGGEAYAMGLHGFAKDCEFSGMGEGGDALSFTLRDTAATRLSWPFSFRLEIRYSLSKRRLEKTHILRNEGREELLYEIGGHEGYNLALLPGERMSDYYLQFEGMDSIRTFELDADLMITRRTRTIGLREGRLELAMRLFDGDALVLDEVGGRTVTIANSRNAEKVRVSFPDFPYLGIWTCPGERETNYVCIEPWSSLPDCDYLDDRLENKRGIRRLAPGASEALGYSMEFGAAE